MNSLFKDREIILASGSPRRREIMEAHGVRPIILQTEVDESLPDGIAPESAVLFLALKKALFAEERILDGRPRGTMIEGFSEPPLILAADTIVYSPFLGIVGKPEDYRDGYRILKSLSGGVHSVYTGVALIETGTVKRSCFFERSDVTFRELSDKDIRDYLDSGEPFDKAGGYAIQSGFGEKNVLKFEGDYENIIGLPWPRCEAEISKLFA